MLIIQGKKASFSACMYTCINVWTYINIYNIYTCPYIYICPPGYHHSSFVATHALEHEHLYDTYTYAFHFSNDQLSNDQVKY